VGLDVSILIVTFECRDEALDCLRSIFAEAGSVTYEVVVVDNGSTDGTADAIRSGFPDARLVALPENVGFAAGVNRAAEAAAGDFLLLLNPDTVVHSSTVGHIVDFARSHPSYGLYGGRTLDPDGTVHPGSCWGKPTLWSTFCFATMLSSAFKRSPVFDPESLGGWQRDSVREVDIVTGCLLLVRRSLWDELGGFDERFFMYGEDADLAFRATRLGFRHVITPDAVVTHEIGVSSSSRSDKLILLLRGKATLIRKHWPAGRREVGLGLLWVGIGLRALVAKAARTDDETGTGAGKWKPVWRARRSWLKGYADGTAPQSP
jgi:N-acetylglucosaminyl-diphospho-decaprenol L-rhamnosyltransferase